MIGAVTNDDRKQSIARSSDHRGRAQRSKPINHCGGIVSPWPQAYRWVAAPASKAKQLMHLVLLEEQGSLHTSQRLTKP